MTSILGPYSTPPPLWTQNDIIVTLYYDIIVTLYYDVIVTNTDRILPTPLPPRLRSSLKYPPLWRVINVFLPIWLLFLCLIACYDMIFDFFYRFQVSPPNTRLPCANRCLRRACAWRDQSVTSPTRSQRNWLAERRTQNSKPYSAKASRQPDPVQSKCRRLTLLGKG